MSNINFSYNQFSLCLGSTTSPISVLGFSSSLIQFNGDYEVTITIKRSSGFSLPPFLNQRASLCWNVREQEHFLHGIIVKVHDNRAPGVLVDQIVMNSPLVLLNLSPQSIVYADMDLPQLLIKVLEQSGWQNNIDFQFCSNRKYPVRQYIVQYQETALAFVQRQCAQWGIFFSFIHKENRPLLVLSEDIVSFSQQFIAKALNFNNSMTKRCLLTKTVSLNDYNANAPSLSLARQIASKEKVAGIGEVYRLYEHYLNMDEGQLLTQLRCEALDCQREQLIVTTNDVSLALGQRVNSADHGSFHIIALQQFAEINSENVSHSHYFVITLLRACLPYRPPAPQLFNMPDCLAIIISEHVDEAGHYFISPLFDQHQQSNTYPVRLSQPYAGYSAGFHFPLQKGNTVLISHINGDPDRPVIMGVIPDEYSPSPVAFLNNTKQIMQTPLGNQLLFDDAKDQQQIVLSTAAQEIYTQLNASKAVPVISLTSQKDMALQAAREISQNANGFFIQSINHDFTIAVQQKHQIITQQGDIILQSGNNLRSIAKESIQIQSQQNCYLTAEQTLHWQAQQQLILSAAQINFNAYQTSFYFQVNNALHVQTQRKIMISQSGATLSIDASGINIDAKQVNFNTPLFISAPIQIKAKPINDATQSLKQTNVQLSFYNEFDEILTEQNLHGAYQLLDSEGNNLWLGGLMPRLSHYNLMQQNLRLEHSTIAVVAAAKQQQLPSNRLQLPRGSIEIKDDIETEYIQLQTVHYPIYKTISPVVENPYQHICEAITNDEIHYFKQNGRSVTIFIHGYNVPDGQFPGSEVICNTNGVLTTMGDPWYFNRTVKDLEQSLKGGNASDIRQKLQQETDQSNEFDEPVNGIGAHNWLLHMEYNLNCAAAGTYPFPWSIHALKYSRILFIRWAGDVGNNGFEKAFNFGGAELNALAAANALVPVIQQLLHAEVSINLIAHSLGNLTLIKLMDIFGRLQQCPFDAVVMWQPALASTALSPQLSPEMEVRIKNVSSNSLSVGTDLALVAAKDVAAITGALACAGLSLYGDYLKLQAARINDPSHTCSLEELFDKDPFAYFPYAHQSAKKINVLYSANDDVLKFAYMPQDVFSNLSQWGFIHEAMGLVGADSKTQIALGIKLNNIDQKNWLLSHSDMKIPSQALFENIYKKYVINIGQGINKFGRYNFN